MIIEQEFLDKYEECRITLYNNYLRMSKDLRLKLADESLQDIVIVSCQNLFTDIMDISDNSVSDDFDGETEELDDETVIKNKCLSDSRYKILEFIALTGISAYKHVSNIDIARLTESQFGFDMCFDNLTSFFGVNEGTVKSEESVYGTITAQLLSTARKISFEEYMEGKYYLEDIKNVMQLTKASASYSTSNSELLDTLAVEFKDAINSNLNTIHDRYKYIMNGAFGINDYVGVFTQGTIASFQRVNGYGKADVVEPDDTLSSRYAPVLNEILKVHNISEVSIGGKTFSGRQFSKDAILMGYTMFGGGTPDSVPIYFPMKILEIISKCKFTRKTELLNYSKLPAKEVGSLDKYLSILKEEFSDDMIDYLYFALYSYVDSEPRRKDIMSETTQKFMQKHPQSAVDPNSREYKLVYKRVVEDLIADVLLARSNKYNYYDNMMEYARNNLRYYTDCVTTAVVYDTCTVIKTKARNRIIQDIVEFRFKVCSKLYNPEYRNTMFLQSLAKSLGLSFSDMSGIEHTDCHVDNWGFTHIDLKYIADKDKVYAKPVFAYKALEKLIERMEQGEAEDGASPLGWDNILLGRDLQDGLFTSGKMSIQGVVLQNNRIHYIIAGSRSGKGVMCYNIFATAIGSMIPMFYLDRKPDTATVLRQLSPEMFCFNGGEPNADIDYTGQFAVDKYNFKIPKYLEKDFVDSRTKFDYAYFRSIMLYLTMVCFADDSSPTNSCEMHDRLVDFFKNGSILVLDEFSNYMTDFLGSKLTAMGGGWFQNIPSPYGIKASITDYYKNYTKAKDALAKKDTEFNQKALEDAKEEVYHEFDLRGLYFAAVADAYKDSLDSIRSLQNAGGSAMKKMHIFVIGQDFERFEDALSASDWFNLGGGTNRNKFNSSSGIIPLLHLLKSLPSDVIAGYQPDRGAYLAQGQKMGYKTKDILNQSRRCFAYRTMGTITANDINAITDTEKHFKSRDSVDSYLNSWKYFKPFLILNNAEVPPESILRNDGSIPTDALTEMRKGRLEAPDGVKHLESQYVGQCLTQSEAAGLSWDDLLGDNMDSAGNFSQGVGFEGYISMLNGGIPVDSMASSGRMATAFVQNVLHYDGTWEDFVCDFRPEWIICPSWGKNGTTPEFRLRDSFFKPDLLRKGFADFMRDKLESLQPYYASSTDNIGLDVSSIEPDEDELYDDSGSFDNFETNVPFDEGDYDDSYEDDGYSSGQRYSGSPLAGNNEDVFAGLDEYEDEEEDEVMSDSEIDMISRAIIQASGCNFIGGNYDIVLNMVKVTLRNWGW